MHQWSDPNGRVGGGTEKENLCGGYFKLRVHISFSAGVIGFERTQYTVSEGAPSVEVCVVLIEPQDPANVSADVLTLINVMSSSDTAEAIGNTAEGIGKVDWKMTVLYYLVWLF